MTAKAIKRKKKSINISVMPTICVGITILMFLFSKPIEESIIRGMSLSALRIIPTLFPFMILSDLWICSLSSEDNNVLFKCISRFLGISYESVNSLVIGIFCGFPLGVKSAVELYKNKLISNNELQHIIPIINMPSIAFVISGVGAGIYKSTLIGVFLYFSTLAASILVACFDHTKRKKSPKSIFIIKQNFNLVESIKKAGASSITIASYIIFFSGVIGMLSAITNNPLISTLISTTLEVGNSVSMIGSSNLLPCIKLPLTSFALGFSGFSVHFQAFAFLPKEISKSEYLLKKLLIGLLSAIITFIFFMFVN